MAPASTTEPGTRTERTLLVGDIADSGPWRPPSVSGGVGGAGGTLLDRFFTGSSGRRSSAAAGSGSLCNTTLGLSSVHAVRMSDASATVTIFIAQSLASSDALWHPGTVGVSI